MSAISSRRSTSVASLDDEVDQAVESLLAMSAPSVEDSLRSERLAGDSVGEERDHPVDERKRDRVCGNATGRLTAGTSLPETGSGEKRGKNELLQLAADIRALRGTLGIVGSPTPPSPFGIEAAVTSSAADGQVTSPKDVSIMDSECQTTEKDSLPDCQRASNTVARRMTFAELMEEHAMFRLSKKKTTASPVAMKEMASSGQRGARHLTAQSASSAVQADSEPSSSQQAADRGAKRVSRRADEDIDRLVRLMAKTSGSGRGPQSVQQGWRPGGGTKDHSSGLKKSAFPDKMPQSENSRGVAKLGVVGHVPAYSMRDADPMEENEVRDPSYGTGNQGVEFKDMSRDTGHAIQSLIQENASLRSQLRSLQHDTDTERTALLGKIEALKTKLRARATRQTALEQRVTSLQDSSTDKDKMIAEASSAISRLVSERDALKRENEGAAKAIRRLQSVIHVDGAEVAAESGLVSLSSSLTALEAACRPVVSSEQERLLREVARAEAAEAHVKKLQAYIADLKLVEKKRSSERTQFSQIQQSFLRHQLEVEDLHEDVITILSSNKPNLSRAIKLLTSFRGSLGQDIWKNASTEVQAQVSSKQGPPSVTSPRNGQVDTEYASSNSNESVGGVRRNLHDSFQKQGRGGMAKDFYASPAQETRGPGLSNSWEANKKRSQKSNQGRAVRIQDIYISPAKEKQKQTLHPLDRFVNYLAPQ